MVTSRTTATSIIKAGDRDRKFVQNPQTFLKNLLTLTKFNVNIKPN